MEMSTKTRATYATKTGFTGCHWVQEKLCKNNDKNVILVLRYFQCMLKISISSEKSILCLNLFCFFILFPFYFTFGVFITTFRLIFILVAYFLLLHLYFINQFFFSLNEKFLLRYFKRAAIKVMFRKNNGIIFYFYLELP